MQYGILFLFDHKKAWLPVVINALEAHTATDMMQFPQIGT